MFIVNYRDRVQQLIMALNSGKYQELENDPQYETVLRYKNKWRPIAVAMELANIGEFVENRSSYYSEGCYALKYSVPWDGNGYRYKYYSNWDVSGYVESELNKFYNIDLSPISRTRSFKEAVAHLETHIFPGDKLQNLFEVVNVQLSQIDPVQLDMLMPVAAYITNTKKWSGADISIRSVPNYPPQVSVIFSPDLLSYSRAEQFRVHAKPGHGYWLEVTIDDGTRWTYYETFEAMFAYLEDNYTY